MRSQEKSTGLIWPTLLRDWWENQNVYSVDYECTYDSDESGYYSWYHCKIIAKLAWNQLDKSEDS